MNGLMTTATYPTMASGRRWPNVWDAAATVCVFGALVAVAHVARGTFAPLDAPTAVTISLDPIHLPNYAVRTTLRMFAALVASLLFTLTYATWAAKSRRARLILIPILDILQSVPILGFLSFTVVFFLSLFPGRVLGAELAAIFAIFTSQAWNMAFSMYQSLMTVPGDLDEAARCFRLTAWQRFWRLEVPFAMPGLVWNTMMSMSGGWFFVVAAEAITVGDTTIKLPGIGSYVALALEQRDIVAVGWAILAMLVVILAYDQLLFRPLVAWSAKFRFETTATANAPDPWLLSLLRRTHLLRIAGDWAGNLMVLVGGLRLALPPRAPRHGPPSRLADAAWLGILAIGLAVAIWRIVSFVAEYLHWSDVLTAFAMGCITLLRVVVLMVLASLVWVPIGVWLGLRPAWARRAQPVAQFLAAFPANLLFPVFVVVIVHFNINPDIGLTPLMVLGTQWYILFNVTAGAAAFPGDLREAAENFRVGGWLWWRRVILPGIFPYYITGAITASGGSWNAAIVAEVASWGDTKLTAHGLGAYIAAATDAGDTPRIVLGVVVMSMFVVAFNRVLWRPLYAYASRRLTFS
jgi:NitT/TauT family transport system permease protein